MRKQAMGAAAHVNSVSCELNFAASRRNVVNAWNAGCRHTRLRRGGRDAPPLRGVPRTLLLELSRATSASSPSASSWRAALTAASVNCGSTRACTDCERTPQPELGGSAAHGFEGRVIHAAVVPHDRQSEHGALPELHRERGGGAGYELLMDPSASQAVSGSRWWRRDAPVSGTPFSKNAPGGCAMWVRGETI